MNKYFYTFGTDTKFPFQRGWVEVHADNWNEAHTKFRSRFPDQHKDCLSCAFFYEEQVFMNTRMPHGGNLGEFCHEVIE